MQGQLFNTGTARAMYRSRSLSIYASDVIGAIKAYLDFAKIVYDIEISFGVVQTREVVDFDSYSLNVVRLSVYTATR